LTGDKSAYNLDMLQEGNDEKISELTRIMFIPEESVEQLPMASFSFGRLLGGPSIRCSAMT